jgi:hypothetical protein
MKIQLIDGQPFIATRNGKRETIQTLADLMNDAHQIIRAANRVINGLRSAEQDAQKQSEGAVLNLVDASPHRSELLAIRAEIANHERDIREAHSGMIEARSLIDQHAAATIRQADKDRLNQLITPFNNTLKEHQA